MPGTQENWHHGQNSLEHVYFFRWIEVKFFWKNQPLGGLAAFLVYIYRVHTSLYVEERFIGGIYYFFLFDTREVDQSVVRLSRAPACNPLSMKLRVWARTSRVCQRGTFSPLAWGWGTFSNKQLYVCPSVLAWFFSSLVWETCRFGNKHRLTGLVLHVVF